MSLSPLCVGSSRTEGDGRHEGGGGDDGANHPPPRQRARLHILQRALDHGVVLHVIPTIWSLSAISAIMILLVLRTCTFHSRGSFARGLPPLVSGVEDGRDGPFIRDVQPALIGRKGLTTIP